MARPDASEVLAKLPVEYLDLDRPRKKRKVVAESLEGDLVDLGERVAALASALKSLRGKPAASKEIAAELKKYLGLLGEASKRVAAIKVAAILAGEREQQESIAAEVAQL